MRIRVQYSYCWGDREKRVCCPVQYVFDVVDEEDTVRDVLYQFESRTSVLADEVNFRLCYVENSGTVSHVDLDNDWYLCDYVDWVEDDPSIAAFCFVLMHRRVAVVPLDHRCAAGA